MSIGETIVQRLATITTVRQIAQSITNTEYFQAACQELELALTSLRYVLEASFRTDDQYCTIDLHSAED